MRMVMCVNQEVRLEQRIQMSLLCVCCGQPLHDDEAEKILDEILMQQETTAGKQVPRCPKCFKIQDCSVAMKRHISNFNSGRSQYLRKKAGL